jgi:hypothetical protein
MPAISSEVFLRFLIYSRLILGSKEPSSLLHIGGNNAHISVTSEDYGTLLYSSGINIVFGKNGRMFECCMKLECQIANTEYHYIVSIVTVVRYL